MAQRQQIGGQPGLPNGAQRAPIPNILGMAAGVAGVAGVAGSPVAPSQNLAVPGQNRPRGPMAPPMTGQAPMPNGFRMQPPQQLMTGAPQAPMQMQGPSQFPANNTPSLDAPLLNSAQHVAQQQRQRISMQQNGQLQPPGQPHTSPPRSANGMSPPGFPQMQNGNMMGFSTPNGNVSSPGGAQSPQDQGGSPHMGQQHSPVPQLMAIQEQIRQTHPNMPQQEIIRRSQEQLHQKYAQQNRQVAHNAMNAAAGNMAGNMSSGNMSNANNSPQLAMALYQQTLQKHQQLQSGAVGSPMAGPSSAGGSGHSRTPSGNSSK